MATPTLIPVSEYLNTFYRPDRDFVDGVLIERNMGGQQHSRLQAFLCSVFFQKSEAWAIRALPEQRVQTSPSHYRIADLCILREGDPNDPIIRKAPLLCIEIFSRRDTLKEMQERVDDYLGMGVDHIRLIDPSAAKPSSLTAPAFVPRKTPSSPSPAHPSASRSPTSSTNSTCSPPAAKANYLWV